MMDPRRNLRIGTQTIGPKYHFTDEGPLVETARGILAMGSDVLKISLKPSHYGIEAPADWRLVDNISQLPDFAKVLRMPFRNVFLWAQPHTTADRSPLDAVWDDDRAETIHREMYDLAAWLLKTFSGSGKTFHLGNWEGDWILLEGFDFSKEPDPSRVGGLLRNFQIRQRAVADARRDTPHQDVWVGHYIEVNRPLDALDKGMQRLTNCILPEVEVDLVSYSAYDALRPDRLTEALDYIESNARFTSYFDGHFERKVFVGEYDAYEDYHVNGYADPARQAQNTLRVIKAAVGWGCPFVLFWEFYNNEDVRLVHGGGFWLIDSQNQKQPVYHLHESLLAALRSWQDDFLGAHGTLPGNAAWRAFIRDWRFVEQPTW